MITHSFFTKEPQNSYRSRVPFSTNIWQNKIEWKGMNFSQDCTLQSSYHGTST